MSGIKTDDADGTCVVIIDRPPLNALTAELLEAGTALLDGLAASPPRGGVVLTGAGRTFTAGVDTALVAAGDRDYRRRLVWAVNDFAAALYRLPCAVVAAVGGHAVGAGGIMCLASDWVVAAAGPSRIGLPEAKAGLPFPRVPQIIMAYGLDPVWRRRLALSSMLLSPEEAVTSGLCDEIAAPGELMPCAIARARAIEAQPGFAVIKADLRRVALAEIDAVYADRRDPLADACSAHLPRRSIAGKTACHKTRMGCYGDFAMIAILQGLRMIIVFTVMTCALILLPLWWKIGLMVAAAGLGGLTVFAFVSAWIEGRPYRRNELLAYNAEMDAAVRSVLRPSGGHDA